MQRTLWIATGLVALSFGALTGADEEKEDEAKEHADAKIAVAKANFTLSQAVEIALKKVRDSKAVEAYLELEGDGVEYEVELLAGNKHMEVKVDGITGAIKDAGKDDDEAAGESRGDRPARAATVGSGNSRT